jgi:methionyl-tRNA formyltransferase
MAKELSVVFAGTPQNAAQTLSDLHAAGVRIVGVLTREDARVGKSKDLTASAVASVAKTFGLNIYKSNTIDDQTLAWLRGLGADIGVVVAYGTIFKKDVLTIPRLGWMNLHYSLLPDLPGPAPVQHAILRGMSRTGVTVFRLDEGIDSGPIIEQTGVAIEESDNTQSLLTRLTTEGSQLLQSVLVSGEKVIAEATAQSSSLPRTMAFKPSRALAKLDFAEPASHLANKVRAMNPEPMAWFEISGVSVRVSRVSVRDSALPIAQARLIDRKVVVGCGVGSLILEEVQPAGKREMSGADWFRGLRAESVEIS